MVKESRGWRSLTYAEHSKGVARFASALRAQGLTKGDRVVIFAENSLAWAQAEWGCQLLGLVPVPIYPTLPADQASYIAQDSGASLALVGDETLWQKLEGLPKCYLTGDKGLIANPDLAPMAEAEMEEALRGIAYEDLATIIYTSGTTGDPKGAMLSHRAFISTCESVRMRIPVDENDLFLSFLPLSHVYERMAGHVLPIALGSCVAYAQSVMTLSSDMVDTKPTIMLCVPRFLDSVRGRILDNVAKQPPLRQKLFSACLSQGLKRARGEFAPFSGLLDKVVATKVRDRTGGRLRFLVSGGAALPEFVADFFAALRLHVLQGYGLTETCGGNCINHPDRIDNRTVGEPLAPAVEVKIADDGEILIRGDCRMIGYFNRPEDTAAAIDQEGWFHTGDIGELSEGKLRITDRKKDLLVLSNGKNIAPQAIENRLRESEWISEAVLLGDGMEFVSALIIPNKNRLARWAKECSISGSARDWVRHPDVAGIIKDEVSRVNKTLADFERVKRHRIIDATFSTETGELTPTLKVKRRVVLEKFRQEIAEMLKSGG
jgi:long-chain acyl-CoA synthetase